MWLYSIVAVLVFVVLSDCDQFVPLYVIEQPDLHKIIENPSRGKAGDGKASKGRIIYPNHEIKMEYGPSKVEMNGAIAKVLSSTVTDAENTHFTYDIQKRFWDVENKNSIRSFWLLRLDTKRGESIVEDPLAEYVDVKRFLERNSVLDNWNKDLLGLYWMNHGEHQILRSRPLFGVKYEEGVFISNTGTSEDLYGIRVLPNEEKVYQENYPANPISEETKETTSQVSLAFLLQLIKDMMEKIEFGKYCIAEEHQDKVLGILDFFGKDLVFRCHQPGEEISFELKMQQVGKEPLETSVVSNGECLYYLKTKPRGLLSAWRGKAGESLQKKKKFSKGDTYIEILHGSRNFNQGASSNLPVIVVDDFEEHFGRRLRIMLHLVILACPYLSDDFDSALRQGQRSVEVLFDCKSKTAMLYEPQSFDEDDQRNPYPIILKEIKDEEDTSVKYICGEKQLPCSPTTAYLDSHLKNQDEEERKKVETVELMSVLKMLSRVQTEFLRLNDIIFKTHDEAKEQMKGKEVKRVGLMIGDQVVLFVENIAEEPLNARQRNGIISLEYTSNIVCAGSVPKHFTYDGLRISKVEPSEDFWLSCDLEYQEKDETMDKIIWLRYLPKRQIIEILKESSPTIMKYCGYDRITAFAAFISEDIFGFNAVFDCESKAFFIWGPYDILKSTMDSFSIPPSNLEEFFYFSEGEKYTNKIDFAYVGVFDYIESHEKFGRPICDIKTNWQVSLKPIKQDDSITKRIYKPFSRMQARNPNLG